MWILFFTVLSQHFLTAFTATPVNSSISGYVKWKLSASPYVIQDNDLVIASDALLHIEPGVKVYVGSGLTIKVKGTLRARGLPDRKIVFTRIPPDFLPLNATMSQPNPTTSFDRTANGQLQLWMADRWRPVCSRNTEWSKTDCRVACRQLGFADGNFTLGPMAKNRTASVEIVAPGCNGNESFGTDYINSSWNGLFDCPGLQENFTIGSTVCQLQDLVGLQCWGVNEYFYPGFWKGIEIHNATLTEIIIPPNWGGSHGNTRLNVSASILEHVEILHAGVNRSMHQTAALSSSPYPPVLKYVRLANNAYDAVNFSLIRGPAILQDVTLEDNGGHGAAISSLLGYLRFTRVTAQRNGGDGSHIRMVSGALYHWPDEALELVHRAQWPCRPGAIPASPVFPFLVVAELPGPTFRASGSCELQIESDQVLQVLTVTLLEVLHDPLASGLVDIWDSSTNEQLAHWELRNDSDPQSRVGVRVGRIYQGISSVKNKIRIQFSWEKPAEQAVCSQLAGCVRAIIQVSVGQTTVPEVEIMDSKFEENMHRGLTISNAWSYVRVVDSVFAYNQFDAGLKLINGSTDLFVHNCSFLQNERTGLNVSTTGGFRQINQSLFVHNRGHGLSVWNPQWPQDGRKPNGVIETQVHTSQFFANWWNGIQFYNSCLPMNLLVNLSQFEMNGANGIRMYSCLNGTMAAMTNFTVGYSNFKANRRAAIWVEPMTWMHGHMTNCTFTNHRHCTIRIDNSLDLVKSEIYRSFPVNYIIKNSEFTGNTGPSVIDIRLTELSELQHVSLMYNKFIGNSIRMRFNLLNPRSSVPAVIAIGSSHIIVQRNHFWNPESDIELASHLSASDKRINATMNFWGSLSDWGLTEWGAIHEAVQGKLFDQNQRYTLARIDYHPVLKDPDLQSNFNTANEPPFVPEFIKTDQRSGQIQIGGRIAVERNRQVELTPLADQEAYYQVTKDILVPSGGILVVHPGVRLYFENGLGLFSQGELKLVGTEAMHIQMDLLDREQTDTLGVLVLPNFTVSETETTDELPNHLLAYGNRSIRLTGGQWEANIYLGRLELLAPLGNDEIPVQSTIRSKEAVWGTVCDHGFGLHAAMLSCSALGLVAHPKDWFLSRTVRDQIALNADRWANASQMPIHLANLDCQGHETDLFQCRGDRALEHSCPHSADVVIRCHRPGWAGVHVTASDPGSRTPIRHVRITNAGLLDYTSTEFVPSLQLDYYSETIVDLQITQGLSNGLQILFSHPLLGAAILDSRIANNFETGLLTRTSSLQVHRCQLEHNLLGAGLEYNPVMTPQDMFAFHSGFVQTLTLFSQTILTDSQRKTLPEGWQLITAREKLHPTGITFANVPSGHLYEKTIYRTELMADEPHQMHQIILHLLDFPVVNCPTSKDQAAVAPNATIGPMQLLPGLLPTSNVPCHTLRCLPLEGNTVEELIIFDGPMDSKDPDRLYSWHIPRDLIRLPLISASSRLTIEFRIHGIRSGSLLFALETRDFQHTQQPRQFPGSGANAHYAAFQFEPDTRYSPIPSLVIQDTVVQQNAVGLRLYHYNDPLDGWDRLFWRHTAEVFKMSNVSLM
ncbi:hypothetical protein PHET_02470 [Paragonimus heterotremus]|uniref:SRCR domain-containing protein n=1 Tax=Paragonimus heterotremus TaxID=100268 RepID=A0A8J4T4A0_9TREM|nr:hypothetical protein PHET_02470 [Paragonimus heterotremus]